MIFNSIKNEKIDYQCLDQIRHPTSDLYLCYCGIEFCPPDHIYGPTIRSEYLLHFIFSGKGYYKIQGKTYEFKKGQASLSVEHPVCNLTVPMEQFRELTDLIIGAKELTISNEIKRVGYLYHILAKLIASNQKKSTGPIPLNYPAETYAQYALQYIELNCNHINVTDIVNHVGIDRSYLYTVFKRYYHVSPRNTLFFSA